MELWQCYTSNCKYSCGGVSAGNEEAIIILQLMAQTMQDAGPAVADQPFSKGRELSASLPCLLALVCSQGAKAVCCSALARAAVAVGCSLHEISLEVVWEGF